MTQLFSPTVRVTSQVVSTAALRRYLFAISQYCRSVSDLTNEDKLPPTPFHSAEEPPFSLSDYIIGIGRRLRLNRLTVLLASVYVARTAQRTGRAPSILSIHRLFAASLLLASKVRGDPIAADCSFATSAGLPEAEVDELLSVVQYLLTDDLTVSETDMEIMYVRLEAASKLTLRSEITAAVATAFGVTFDRPQLSRTPSGPNRAFARSGSTCLQETVSERWDTELTRESRDSSFASGSALSAARGLRTGLSSPTDPSIVSTPLPKSEPTTPQCALPTFAPRFSTKRDSA